jgi:hypothetical protein
VEELGIYFTLNEWYLSLLVILMYRRVILATVGRPECATVNRKNCWSKGDGEETGGGKVSALPLFAPSRTQICKDERFTTPSLPRREKVNK